MPDDLLATVEKALEKYLIRTPVTCMEDVYRTWLRELVARCREAEAKRDAARAEALAHRQEREYWFDEGWKSARRTKSAEYQESEAALRHSAYLSTLERTP